MALGPVQLEVIVERSIRALRVSGYIIDYRVDTLHHRAALHVNVMLRDDTPRHYEITDIEIMQGGPDAALRWLDVVEQDIRTLADRIGCQQSYAGQQMAMPGPSRTATEMRMLHQRAQYQQQARSQGNARQWQAEYLGNWDSHIWGAPTPKDHVAEQRSKDLFVLVAGKDAFQVLIAGAPLPMTGSSGTAYTLHKRASYCVERVSDGAKLCAVVPGVPLFDHLLGIKLLVENDEPKFLATANVAHGGGFAAGDMQAMMSEMIRQRSGQMAQNMMANNALLQRLRQYEPPAQAITALGGIGQLLGGL